MTGLREPAGTPYGSDSAQRRCQGLLCLLCVCRNVCWTAWRDKYTYQIYFGISCITMSLFLHEERRYLRGEVDKPVGESFLERDTISAVTVKFNVLLLIFATLGVLSSVLVLIGLKLNNRALLLPWILVMIADLLVECAHFMYLIVIETLKFEPLTAMLFTIDFFIMCLNIYCLLCVISQYQEYKAGRGQADDDSYTCPTNIQYSPPAPSCLPQTKTAALSPVICPHTNCTLIPEETQINGVAASPPTLRLPAAQPTATPVVRCTQRGASLLLVKKHVKFSAGDKPKVGCCTGIIHPSENLGSKDGGMTTTTATATVLACKPPNGLVILGAIETLPEYSEDKLSWHEQKLTPAPATQRYPAKTDHQCQQGDH
ncbi:uncharacterized protein LOC118467358 isoform X2 [Anopheles albimanus]|uniref:uncharacterized protein LOC118467358 isoform X2 n=1 Tax=Anopheles albimanus TaxID=7167 RepID=UPI001641C761|nr:uncharacterized protein LOC118467358 isoform X2 [Anopheles albimanus]